MVDEQIAEGQASEEQTPEEQMEAPEEKIHFDVIYRCLRCGTTAANSELERLPEIKCICGFRVFTKVRPPMPKTIRAI